jgi:hypothetical protein
MSRMKKLIDKLLSHIQEGELKLAKSILRWKFQKERKPVPGEEELNLAAKRFLDEARKIAGKRGKNLYEILKEEAREFFDSKPS